jgi:hypothetical protein
MTVSPAYQILAAWGSIFAVTLGRNLIEGFLGRLFGGRPLQAVLSVLVAVAAIVLGGDWLLTRFGRTVPAIVTGKQDVVDVARDGSWTRSMSIEARYTPRGFRTPAPVYIPIGAAVYDLVQKGQTIPIRCVPLAPTFCLLKYDSLREWGLRTLEDGLDRGQALFVLGLPIVVFWLGVAEWTADRPVRRWISRALFAGWTVALLVTTMRSGSTQAGGARFQGAARVRDVRLVSSYGLLAPLITIPLAHPYAVVQLALSPNGRRDTVVAVDEVDSVTAAGITAGAAFLVSYAVTNPRDARLLGARRDFRDGNVRRNTLLTLGLLLLLVVPVVLLETTRAKASGQRVPSRQPTPP